MAVAPASMQLDPLPLSRDFSEVRASEISPSRYRCSKTLTCNTRARHPQIAWCANVVVRLGRVFKRYTTASLHKHFDGSNQWRHPHRLQSTHKYQRSPKHLREAQDEPSRPRVPERLRRGRYLAADWLAPAYHNQATCSANAHTACVHEHGARAAAGASATQSCANDLNSP